MATQTIPNLPDEPFHTLRVRLDDRDYTLEFLYSTRGENWSLSIYDEENEPVVLGLKLFTGVPLLAAYKRDERVPRGELFLVALGSDQSPPKLAELGDGLRCELTYYPEADLVDIAAELGA
jgi:hypothetical protein